MTLFARFRFVRVVSFLTVRAVHFNSFQININFATVVPVSLGTRPSVVSQAPPCICFLTTTHIFTHGCGFLQAVFDNKCFWRRKIKARRHGSTLRQGFRSSAPSTQHKA